MNAAHLHLVLNHVPVVGIPIGLVALAWGTWRRSEEVVRAGLGLLVAMGVAALAVYLTGEPAEEIVEGLANTSETALEAHEEAGAWSMYAALALAALASIGLVAGRARELSRAVLLALALAATAVTGSMAYTAYLGGQIRHPELRSDSPAVGEPELLDAPDDGDSGS